MQSHDDVPEHIHKQLVTEEQQRLERHPNLPANAATPLPPINITNVLPPSQPFIADSLDSTDPPAPHFSNITCLDIPGPRDTAVRMYSEWQQSNVLDEDWMKDFQKARDVALKRRLDLELINAAQDPNLFIGKV